MVDAITLAYYERISRLYDAVRLLLAHDHSEEAMVLARPMFTESLWLGELERSPDLRINYVWGWTVNSITEAEGLLRVGEAMGMGVPAERDATIKGRYRTVEKIAREQGAKGKPRQFPDEKLMAKRQGVGGDLHAFVLSHQMVHGSEVAHMFVPGRLAVPSDRDEVDRLVMTCNVGAFALRSAAWAHVHTSAVLEWPGSKAIVGYFEGLNRLHLDR